MSASRNYLLLFALAGCLTPTATVWAQAYGAETFVEHNDLRWFEPVELDLDGRIEPEAGYFFRMEKLSWAMTGERVEVGAPGIINPSEQIYAPIPDAIIQANIDLYSAPFELTGDAVADQTKLDQIAQILSVEYTGEYRVVDTGEVDDLDQPITYLAPEVVPGSGDQPPPLYNVENGIKDAIPNADFAWGERYELGFSDGERGWVVGILDGPEQELNRVYGAGPGSVYTSQSITGFADFDPFYGSDPQDLDQDGQLDNEGEINDIYALGFGSVAMNFEAQEDFFVGFRDYMLNFFPGAGTVYGPIYDVGNYGGDDDGVLTADGDDDAPAFADDLNGNGRTFEVITADLNGDGEIDDDEIFGTFLDYGDLYAFDIFFDDVTVRSVTEMDGIELLLTHDLSTQHHLDRGRRDALRLSYGVRYLQLSDLFSWEGRGSILGKTGAEVDIENQLVGPQIGLRWTRDHGKWDFSVDGRFMFAYNVVDRGLEGIFAQGATPGALNNAINVRTTTSVVGDRQDDFSPLAELRIEARYKLSKAIALKVGYTGKFIDNIERASQAMRYTAPSFSLKDGKSDIFINGVNAGFELRY